MKLFNFVFYSVVISPFVLILFKWIGWIAWSWLITVFVAIAIPLVVFLAFLILAIWIIKTMSPDEWGQ